MGVEADFGNFERFIGGSATPSFQQWRKAFFPRLPSILIVVPDPARRRMIRAVVQETIPISVVRLRLTTMPQLQKGPHAAIWQQVTPVAGIDRHFGAFEGDDENVSRDLL